MFSHQIQSQMDMPLTPRAVDLQANRGPEVLKVIYPLSVLATIAVFGRFWSRKVMKMSWGLDDYAIVVSLVLTWGCCVGITILVHFGVGRHMQTLSPQDLVHFKKSYFGVNLVYIVTPVSIKIAALLLYKRIFNTAKFRFRANCFIAFNIAWWFAETITGIFTCIPVAGAWDTSLNPKCQNLRDYDIVYAVFNITIDVAILTLPLYMIWHIKIKLAQKIALTFVFLIGGLECVVALIRLLTSILFLNNPDLTYLITDAYIWTVVEPAIGVISVCLITMRPLLSYLFPNHFASSNSSNMKPKRSHSGNNNIVGSFKRLTEHSSRVTERSTTIPKPTVTTTAGADSSEGLNVWEHGIMVTTDLELRSLDRMPS